MGSHESSTGLPRAGEHLVWDVAEPVVWGELRRSRARDRATQQTFGALQQELRGIDRSLGELTTARQSEMGEVARLREEIREQARRVHALEDDRKAREAVQEAAEEAEERGELADRRALWRRLLLLAGIGGGGVGLGVGGSELLGALARALAGGG